MIGKIKKLILPLMLVSIIMFAALFAMRFEVAMFFSDIELNFGRPYLDHPYLERPNSDAKRNSQPQTKASSSQNSGQGDCQFVSAQHRVSTKQAVDTAADQGLKNIEVDLIFEVDEVFITHPSDETASTAKFSLREFQKNYAQSFNTIVFDIKKVNSTDEQAVKQLTQLSLDKNKVIFTGRRCRLLYKIQSELNHPAGCESIGLVGNHVLGFRYWSTNYRNIRSWQESYLKITELKTLLWTFNSKESAEKFCRLKPDIVLLKPASI